MSSRQAPARAATIAQLAVEDPLGAASYDGGDGGSSYGGGGALDATPREPRFSHVGQAAEARAIAAGGGYDPLTWLPKESVAVTAGEPRVPGRDPMDRRGVRVRAWAGLDHPGGGGKE
eukprot:5116468-Prymnesium_polylepis.1